MDFGAAFTWLMQGREVTREGWPDGLRLKLAPATDTEAAHPVITYADGRKDQAYQHPVMDLWHSADWVPADGLPAAPPGYGEALDLLGRVLHLRMNGERAPGGNETWREAERDIEVFLRRARGMMGP